MAFLTPGSKTLLLLASLAIAGPCPGLTIALDYSSDAAGMNFFGNRPQAKAAVDAAAADLNALLAPTHLTAIGPTGTPNIDLISGVNGATHADTNWDFQYTDPTTGIVTTITSPTLAADTVKVFVGMSGLGAGLLGQGSPGGAKIGVSASGSGSQIITAVANMQTLSDSYVGRGAGPTINHFTGSMTLGGTFASFSLKQGPTIGSLSFNNDTDGNGTQDSLTTLDNFWHYNNKTAVVAGKNDLYSVALHELLHTVGFGASDTWTSKMSGTTWLGSNAIATNGGSGANLVDSSTDHIRNGLISTNIYTGSAQEAAMDPSLVSGTRKQLTAMDVAFVKDLGFSVAPVPEPVGGLLVWTTAVVFFARRRRA